MLEKLKKLKFNIGWKSLILIGVFAILLFVDLITKYFAEKDGWNFTVIPNFIEVTSGSHNDGAAFNIFSGAQIFLIVLTFIMLAVLIFVFVVLPERFILLKIAVSMITAGALGNLIDRLAFNYVRDFVGLNMLFTTAICNFADFWIVIGTVIAIIDILFINEWAILPLTKSAKEAQAKRNAEESVSGEIEEVTEQTQMEESADEQNKDEDNG